MGTYGYKLYDSDEASDLKARFHILLNQNQNVDEITKQLIDDNQTMIEDSDEAPIFWCVIADLQWELGRLNNEIKEKAMYYLKNGFDLERWRDEDESSYKKRQRVADKLLEKLESPQPFPKKIRNKKTFVCDWKIGDVFAYKLEKDKEIIKKEISTDGNYVVFQKVDEYKDLDNNILPVIRIFYPFLESISEYEDFNKMKVLKLMNSNIDNMYRCILDKRTGKYFNKKNIIKITSSDIKSINEYIPKNFLEWKLIVWHHFSYWMYVYQYLYISNYKNKD